MCGIIGGISTNKAIMPILMSALRRLEYRGYDSFGIGTYNKENKNITIEKKIGAPSNYSEEDFRTGNNGTIGIGHTRWATHGEVSVQNAHPHHMQHEDKEICIVHNGIVENLTELTRCLDHSTLAQLKSETDTEIIAAFMTQAIKNGLSGLQAFEHTCQKIRGQFALIVFYKDKNSKEIFAQRNTLPLYIQESISDQTKLLCSDPEGFEDLHTDCYLLGQRETFILEKSKTTDLRSISIAQSSSRGESDNKSFSTMMEKEIHEQPGIVRKHLQENQIHIQKIVSQKWSQIHLIGCGTSYHAALIGAYWFEKICNIPAQAFIASEYKYNPPLSCNQSSLAILLSQSGETADLLTLLPHIEKNYRYKLSLCNNPNSTLVNHTDFNIDLEAGKEIGVASTKAFTAQILCLIKVISTLEKSLAKKTISERNDDSLNLSHNIHQVLQLEAWELLARRLSKYKHLLILGRGPMLAVAQEGALKIKEITYMHAQALPTGELKHGSLALIDETCPVIVNLNYDNYIDKNLLACQELLARKAKLIIIADRRIEIPFREKLYDFIQIPSVSENYGPILFTIPFQLLALKIAQILGHDVDKPRNLAKSVTVE